MTRLGGQGWEDKGEDKAGRTRLGGDEGGRGTERLRGKRRRESGGRVGRRVQRL